MNSIIPSDPKPTKEAYLTALRILRENHKVSDDPTGSPLRRAQLFTGEESRITNVTDANVPDSTDPINSFLANIALGGRSERRNIPTPSLPTRNASLLVPQSPVSETPASQPVNIAPIGSSSSEKLKNSANIPLQRLSNGSDSTGGIIKFGRKATRRFTMVSNMLPKYKLDEVAKQKIAVALKEINCWSDDEDYEAVKKLKAIEEDSDLSSGSDSDQELSLEALASKKQHTHQSVKAMGNTLKDSNLVSKKYRGLHPQTSSKSATIQPTPPAHSSAKERPNLMRPKHTIYQTKQQTAKQAYLEQQKELQRQQAKEIVVKKAVKLIIKLRAEEETQQKRSELAKKYNLSTLAMLSIESIAMARVGKILKQALVLAVDKRIKLNKKSKRRLIRENRAATTIFWCYRKYRVHMLLFCVVKFIRAKALYFKNQEIQEEIDYRMRTAMRRVKEDKQFKVWKSEQSVKSTFPVKPPVSEFAPIIAFTRKNFLANNPVVAPVSVMSPAPIIPMSETQINVPESGPPASTPGAITIDTSVGNTFLTEPNTSANSRVSSPRPPTSPRAKNAKDNKDTKDKAPAKSPRTQPASPMPVKKDIVKSASRADTTASAGESKLFTTSLSPRNATPAVTTATAAAISNSLVPVAPSKPKPLTKEEKEFNYHRPDLAPFSTMINNLISNNSLFKSQQQSEPSWVDVASVSADYGKVYNSTNNTTNSKLKSPAYAALEKFCGITQEDLERRKLAKNKDLVNLKLKSFGHSIVSL